MNIRPSLAAPLCLALVLAACSDSHETEPSETGSYSDVEGAQETSEAQYRLVLGDADDGTVAVLDLIEESVENIGQVDDLTGISTDGRFAYLSGGDGIHVLDSGAWTWDHGDHNHYYRATPRTVGATDVDGSAAGAFGQPTAVLDEAQHAATVLERTALEDGDVKVTSELSDVSGVAVAVGEEVLTGAPDDAGLRVRSLDGDEVTAVEETCTDPEGVARTRSGLVVGCAEGALVLDPDDWSAEQIDYPEGTDPQDRARSFEHRPGSTVLGALRGEDGAWALDVRAGTWTALDVPGAVAVSAAGEDLPVLVLDDDGMLHAFDPEEGNEEHSVELLQDGADDEVPPVIAIDTARAYVNDPAAGVVHEIDYADELRTARTLELDLTPTLMVETGW
ncbi:hypothetical protein [Aeromicrobium sp. CTD01-1L150]|uniref:hypothetical protein n=1 Tax=Aeromicrobium sp. CTD01-1L150 TaxID=3341830 RepID=UPI0035C1EC8E